MIRTTVVIYSLALTVVGLTVFQPDVSTAADPRNGGPPPVHSWPRTFDKGGNTVVMYQPQVDSWDLHAHIRFRSAVAVTAEGSSEQHFGVVAVRADTLVDNEARTVLMTNLDIAARFEGLPQEKAEPLKALVKECLPSLGYVDVSLDEVLAYLNRSAKPKTANLNMAPPPILYSSVPAILVVYIGQPQFKPVKDTGLMFAVNTNWPVFMDMASSTYYLLNGDSWLSSPDAVKGPWAPAQTIPAGFAKLPDGGGWDDVKKHIPGRPATAVPRVIATTEPTELIVTAGPPAYSPISGTRLMYVSNPATPLFLDLVDDAFYFLVSGRWFRATSVTGPWAAASADLPAEFAKIPVDSPMAFVLPSVPKTQEASDAVLLASVPHMAKVKIASTTVDVTYDGPPKFVPVEGTKMTYGANTAYEVILDAGQYYCCFNGVWFVSAAASGPWTVCKSVPAEIYTIPPSCPVYNVTYVQVYDSTADTVDVGYTGGYDGEYVGATGTLMFGAGMVAGALLANSDWWYGCNPCFYSYGCAAHYSYAYGGYYRAGGACYGPYGGAGWASAYNPATGTWARGAAVSTPRGSAWGAQAYNPFTNTYAAHAGATNGYKSWGSSYVQQGDKWAEASHESTARGSAGWAENSLGPGRRCRAQQRHQHVGREDEQRKRVREPRRQRLPQHGRQLAEVPRQRQLGGHVLEQADGFVLPAPEQRGRGVQLSEQHDLSCAVRCRSELVELGQRQ